MESRQSMLLATTLHRLTESNNYCTCHELSTVWIHYKARHSAQGPAHRKLVVSVSTACPGLPSHCPPMPGRHHRPPETSALSVHFLRGSCLFSRKSDRDISAIRLSFTSVPTPTLSTAAPNLSKGIPASSLARAHLHPFSTQPPKQAFANAKH